MLVKDKPTLHKFNVSERECCKLYTPCAREDLQDSGNRLFCRGAVSPASMHFLFAVRRLSVFSQCSRTATTYFRSCSSSTRPAGMPCHFARQLRQQVAVACCAINTGCPRRGVWRPSSGGCEGAKRVLMKPCACSRMVGSPFASR